MPTSDNVQDWRVEGCRFDPSKIQIFISKTKLIKTNKWKKLLSR